MALTADAKGLAFAGATELLAAFASGTLSPVEVVDLLLDRIEAIDSKLHALVRVDREAAREAARASLTRFRTGRARPLEGIPVVLKDVYADGDTRAGSRVLEGRETPPLGAVSRRLREAGAVVLGKAATYEFAFGRPSHSSHLPPARNPWDASREPGGSSSGSAVAVAAGLATVATGTDTAGSVRWPAAQCGVVGLKPTYGRIPRSGTIPLAWTLDHAGVLARSVADVGLLLSVVAGRDSSDPTSSPRPVDDYRAAEAGGIREVRLGVPRRLFSTSCAPGISASFEAALEHLGRLGARIVDVVAPSMSEVLAVTYPALLAEAAAYHLPDLRQNLSKYSRDLRVFFTTGLLVDAPFYVDCQRARRRLLHQQRLQLNDLDAFVLPTVGFEAEPIPDASEGLSFLSGEEFALYTMLYNLTGLPAISVPAGFTPAGMPVGLQIVGRPFDEVTVLRLAAAYEAATDWRSQRPRLAEAGP